MAYQDFLLCFIKILLQELHQKCCKVIRCQLFYKIRFLKGSWSDCKLNNLSFNFPQMTTALSEHVLYWIVYISSFVILMWCYAKVMFK